MKTLFILLATLFYFTTITAQDQVLQKKSFLRIYNSEGKKIYKGKIQGFSDSLMIIKKGDKIIKISFNEIHTIKTKRSGGNNFLVGAGSGVLVGTLLGTINPPTDSSGGTFTWAGSSSGEELTAGLMVGTFLGTTVGGITALFKNSKKYSIDGNIEKFKVFKEIMLSY